MCCVEADQGLVAGHGDDPDIHFITNIQTPPCEARREGRYSQGDVPAMKVVTGRPVLPGCQAIHYLGS